MRAAILDGQIVANVVEADDPAKIGAVPCPSKVSKGWTYDGVTWTPPPAPAPDMPRIRAEAKQRLRDQIDEITAPIRAQYPATERETWDQQATEAESLLDDAGAPAPLIRAIAQALGQDPVAYAQAVKAKADAFRALGATAVAARQDGDAMIDAAQTPAEVATALQSAADKVSAAAGALAA